MSNVKSRIQALEEKIADRQATVETQSARWQKFEDDDLEDCERYWEWVVRVFDSLEERFQELVLPELASAEWEQVDMRAFGGFGKDNGFSLLTNAVLALGDAKHRGRKIPHTMPPELCEYFANSPADLFAAPPEKTESEKVGKWWLTASRPQWQWIFGTVSCEPCSLPLPYRGLGLYDVQRIRDEPGQCENLPFKRCPACGGQISWRVNRP